MFELEKNKDNHFSVEMQQKSFLNILTQIYDSLKSSNNSAQAAFIQKLIILINEKDFNAFSEQANSVDMWGGAGAVWEVYIANESGSHEFEKNMLSLILLMEKTNIISKGIKSIKKNFERNLK
jgi:hypothetical protein